MPANSDGARSGTDADLVLDDVLMLRMTLWRVNPTSSESAWGDSDSEGYTNRMKARLDATFAFEGKFDENRKIYTLAMPGDTVKAALWENDSDYWAFPRSLITAHQLEYNQDTKEVVGWTMDGGADGKYYRPGQSGAPTYTKPSS